MAINIGQLKSDPREFMSFQRTASTKDLKRVLNNFGKFENNEHQKALLEVVKHSKAEIRMLAVKNLAKFTDEKLLSLFLKILKEDDASTVRREAVSAIGRMRSEKCIPTLSKLLKDDDPAVIMQAIRGLLVFKKDEKVRRKLLRLKNHPNEIIQEIIFIELMEKKTEPKHPHPYVEPALMNVVVNADVLETLAVLEDESIHLTFTSPPYYNARDYSIYASYQEYLQFLKQVFEATMRVTKEGRFLVVNTSPVIVPRFSRAHASKRYPIPFDLHAILIEMGWEFIDDLVWAKPEASVKNRNAGFLQHRKPLAYKPNSVTEMVMVYRKKSSRLIDWNLKQYSAEILEQSKIGDGYLTSNLWEIDPTFDKTHSAVFPAELCDRIIQYYSLVGDLVFDPFGGSGTFGKAAMRNNRRYFITEIMPEYVERMRVLLASLTIHHEDPAYPSFYTLENFKEAYNSAEKGE